VELLVEIALEACEEDDRGKAKNSEALRNHSGSWSQVLDAFHVVGTDEIVPEEWPANYQQVCEGSHSKSKPNLQMNSLKPELLPASSSLPFSFLLGRLRRWFALFLAALVLVNLLVVLFQVAQRGDVGMGCQQLVRLARELLGS